MEACVGCGCDIGRHVRCVDGKVRCFVVHSGMTTGVIMPYTRQCDCVDYRSEQEEQKKEQQRRKDAQWREDDARFKEIRKISSVDELLGGS